MMKLVSAFGAAVMNLKTKIVDNIDFVKDELLEALQNTFTQLTMQPALAVDNVQPATYPAPRVPHQ